MISFWPSLINPFDNSFTVKAEIQNLLKVLEDFQSAGNMRWNIPPESGNFINLLIKAAGTKTVLEVGTSNGYSGIWIAEALSCTGGQLITIESHEERFQEARKNFAESGLSKHITQIKGHAPEDLEALNNSFDMMFFDATKFEHISYFEKLNSKLKVGGLIISDNINSHAEDLKDFTKLINSTDNFQSSKIDIGTGLLLSLKLS